MNEYFDHNLHTLIVNEEIGYDNLDIFLNGLLTNQPLPVETIERDPEMVFYQKTPGRIVLELIRRADLTRQDVFFDLGSGLGQVATLVKLLTPAVSKGVEIDAAFCFYAKTCADELNVQGIEFINQDARMANYSMGTVFFMYTPFEGQMLRDILQMLHVEAKSRRIRIFTYGPCTPEVAKQEWLTSRTNVQDNAGMFGEFISF
jgi:SAM-dependent methyltransferase